LAIICDVQQGKVARGLHDGIAELRWVKREFTVTVHLQAGEKILDVFLERIKGGIEVEEALYWANQVLLPDRTKRFEREIEKEPQD
jgi:hypothetical protein